MKRPILAAAMLLTLALPAAAQQRMGGPPQSGSGVFEGITLTPAQQKKVDSLYALNQPMRDMMRAQMESNQRPDSAQMVKMRAMRTKALAAYRGVLTPEQQKPFDANAARMQARMDAMGAGAGHGAGAGAGAGQGGAPRQ